MLVFCEFPILIVGRIDRQLMPKTPVEPPPHLTEALRWSAAAYPTRSVSVLDRRGRLAARYSTSELIEVGTAVASRLASVGISNGAPVVVALPTSSSWLEAWLGTLFAGGRPVAISPSGALTPTEETVRRLAVLLRRLEGRHVLCSPSMRKRLEGGEDLPENLVLLTPEEIAALSPAAVDLTTSDPEETAFMQLTSGTTEESRVVCIPHRAAVHNARAIGDSVAESVGGGLEDLAAWEIASWLPLYHDMGLVGGLLSGMILGLEVQLMPPEAFLGRPRSWLAALGSKRRTVSTAPNFGYQFCVEQIDRDLAAGLDLSSWKAALVGAEMVRPETLQGFAEHFACAGFDIGAFRPCYGLAEAALAVTLDRVGGYRTAPIPGGSAGAETVCLGAPLMDTEVWAATPAGERLPDGAVGEIRVRGPGVFSGYLNDADSTRAALDGDCLLTGDLGFLQNGELYLTGRLKEILVVRGQNLMPHELEQIAEREVGGGRCRAACFTIDHATQGEQIVLLAEAPTKDTRELERMESEIRREIGATLGLPLAEFGFVAPGKLPRTTSGKVPRNRLRDEYLAGRIARLDS